VAGGFEVVTVGRVSVDLYPEQVGVALADVRSFAKSLGGSATNVAVAAARLGRRSAVVTKVGDDAFGPFVHQALRGFGVEDGFVGVDAALRTPIVFCEIHPPDHFPLLFYRQPSAPDLQLTAADVADPRIRECEILWTTGTGLSEEPSRGTTLQAMAAHAGGLVIHDLDYRPMLWPDPAAAPAQARRAIAASDVVVGNREEVAMATGCSDPDAGARALLDAGATTAIVKLGPAGVLARRGDESVAVPPVQVDVVNGLGAGDAFGGALCHGLLSGWPLSRIVGFANAAGALVASRLACADAMPTVGEIEQLMAAA
jgi:5-dehydro-2-deoxygluconokinase